MSTLLSDGALLPTDQHPQASPLLRLPRLVRLQIYISAGAIAHPRQLLFINLNNSEVKSTLNRNYRPCFVATLNLFLTCRLVYRDLCRHVYSRHHFFVRSCDDGGLRTLNRLGSEALMGLKLLTIHLNSSSCGLGNVCDRALDPWIKNRQEYDRIDSPLRLGETRTEVSLCTWMYSPASESDT